MIPLLNQIDRDNLNFIVSTPSKKLNRWFETLDDDERQYASNLMTYYSQWLKQNSEEFLQEQEQILNNSSWDESKSIIKSVMNL